MTMDSDQLRFLQQTIQAGIIDGLRELQPMFERRDADARAAMPAIMLATKGTLSIEELATDAYRMADAMEEARKR